jgi:hypothetical protein
VAEYLGHADLSTVARYAHVDRDELHDAAGRLEQLATPLEQRPESATDPDRSIAARDPSIQRPTKPQRSRRRGRRGRRRRQR